MEIRSNINCLVLRWDFKPTALCELEATGRKANTARAGPGKISVRKFMQGKSKYYFPPYFMRKRGFWFPENIKLVSNKKGTPQPRI